MTDTAIFPGQGSQRIGMLAELAADSDLVRATFDEASRAIGRDLWALVSEGSADELNQTRWTQPAMLAGDVAVWRTYVSRGGQMPLAMAGHSLGEYAALVAAGALDFCDALRVVAERGRLMQAAVPKGKGAMAAILGLDDEVVEALCREVAEGQVVAPANYNSPSQLVIAGEANAVERAMLAAREAGARRAMILPVSAPSHCALMAPAAEQLESMLATIEFEAAQIPVIHNVDVREHNTEEGAREALVAQLYSPVRWTATVRLLGSRGISQVGECGPGRVLCGLGRRIERELEWLALEDPDELESSAASWG